MLWLRIRRAHHHGTVLVHIHHLRPLPALLTTAGAASSAGRAPGWRGAPACSHDAMYGRLWHPQLTVSPGGAVGSRG